MKKKKIWVWIIIVIGLANGFMLGKGVYNSYEYSKYYDYEGTKIVSEELEYESLGSSQSVTRESENHDIQRLWYQPRVLSGIEDIGTFKFEKSKVKVDTKVKSGKLKVVITDSKDSVILYEGNGEAEIDIPLGECKVRVVGSWGTGKLEITGI